MHKINLIFLFVLMVFTTQITKAQLVDNDATWLPSSASDEFNSGSLNTSKWNADTGPGWGREYKDPVNILFSYNPGYMTIKADTLATPIIVVNPYNAADIDTSTFRSGAIMARSPFSTKYGYYETSAIMPQGQGYWPAFWAWAADGTPGGGITPCEAEGWYNEIDYLENNGYTSKSDAMAGGYVHKNPDSCAAIIGDTKGSPTLPLPDGAHSTDEHKYACFWEPSRMTWFFDDKKVWTVNDPVYTPHNPIFTVFDFAIDNWIDGSTAVFPAYFQVNYVRIWQLQPDCNTAVTFCSSALNPATYDYKVKQSISIGGFGCSAPTTISTSDHVNLWATDFILLDEGTRIDYSGSGSFSINVTECPN